MQPLTMRVNIEDFERQVECEYKNEHYSVRSNGAIFRHSRPNKAVRKHDNYWTFGTPNSNGYMLLVTEVVHRIVAVAFLGEPPTPQHIVDHLDTNRQNNRPENLRWLTKLENTLNNSITLKKILFRCGSVEAFLDNPSILNDYVSDDKSFSWMRTVTHQEAKKSWENLSNWAKKDSKVTLNSGGNLGEWIYQINSFSPIKELPKFTRSNTPNAIQKNWKTPCEFPQCPKVNENNPIVVYAANLGAGTIFSKNIYSDSIVTKLATSKDVRTLWVICKNSKNEAMKPWTVAKVTFEDDLFVHTSLGSYFQEVGAEKCFTIEQGFEWTGGESIDDLT